MNKRNMITGIAIVAIVTIIGMMTSRLQSGNSPASLLPGGEPAAPKSLVDQGDQYFAATQLEKAHQAYSSAIQAGEDLARAYAGRAGVYAQWRRFDDASYDYSSSIKVERTPGVLASRCNTYRLLTKYDQALKDCQEAIQLDPEYVDAYIAISLVYLERGDFEAATASVNKGLEIDPESSALYYALAQVEINSGNTEAGIADLTHAIELSPENPQLYWERGFLMYMSGKIPETRADMQKVIDVGVTGRDDELIFKAGSLLESMKGSP